MSVPREPSRRSAVEPFHVMSVLAAAARRQETHGDVISRKEVGMRAPSRCRTMRRECSVENRQSVSKLMTRNFTG